jgi:hypothetical protein
MAAPQIDPAAVHIALAQHICPMPPHTSQVRAAPTPPPVHVAPAAVQVLPQHA